MNKSLLRQDGVADSNTSLDTQSSTVTFKRGKVIDFQKLTKAVHSAGFKAGGIRIWARGTVKRTEGRFSLIITGSNQILPLTENEQITRLEAFPGKEIKVVGKLDFDQKPPSLIVERFEM